MRLVKVEDLKGNEKLARPIMTDNYQELLAEGVVLKQDYIEKLKQLNVTEVLINDSKLNAEQVVILREDVEDFFKEKVRSVMERHIYHNNKDLEELSKTADNIITNILSNDEVIEQIYDIRERSADIYEHSISVCSLAVLVSLKLKMSKESIHDIGVAALFHDIGLRYLNFNYTNQLLEDLTEKDLIEYKKHPAYAYSALENETWISKEAKTIILQHHERLDGSGYPLHTKDLEKEADIVAVCESFDEMICGIGCNRVRIYEAVEYMKVSRGTGFYETVVDALLDFTAVYPAGTLVLLNTGEWGVVVRQNKQFPERPVLKLIKKSDGTTMDEDVECDLLEQHSIFIEKVIM